jgi:hypothetical protein
MNFPLCVSVCVCVCVLCVGCERFDFCVLIFLSVGCNGRSAKFWSILSADDFECGSFGFGLEMIMSHKK